MESISIDVTRHTLHPDISTLRIKGFLYANTLANLDKTVQPLLPGNKKLIIDLSETNYISSGGWGLLITIFQRFSEMGGELVLAGMKPEVFDAFELLEYDKVLRFFPSEDSALKEGFANMATPKI